MSDIDWPLAITLAVLFVVMSIVRWRYFRSAAKRWGIRRAGKGDKGPDVTPAKRDE